MNRAAARFILRTGSAGSKGCAPARHNVNRAANHRSRLGTPISRLAFLTLVASAARRLFCLRLNFAVAFEFPVALDFVAAACFFRRASLTLPLHLPLPLPLPLPLHLTSPLNL